MKYSISNIFSFLALPLLMTAGSPTPATSLGNTTTETARGLNDSLSKRADPSLFAPGENNLTNNLPQIQDVVDFTKDGKAGKDDPNGEFYFERAFALVVYAIAHVDHGNQLKALFKEAEDQPGFYELSYFDPVKHEPTKTLVGYTELSDMEGNKSEDFNNRWWIAALWGVMKTEWDTYYETAEFKDGRLERQPKDKGKAYHEALTGYKTKWQLREGWNIGHEFDVNAAHWLMTVLLRRNVVVSRYTYDVDVEVLRHNDLQKLKEHGPALWVGNMGGQDKDDSFEEYFGFFLQDVKPKKDFNIVLMRPEGGQEAGSFGLIPQDTRQFPFFLHLFDLTESWEEHWYEKEEPGIDAMKNDPPSALETNPGS